MSEEYKINFVIGDWSGDGHGLSDTFYAHSNKPVAAVREAYFAAVKNTCFDFEEKCCGEYREDTLSEEALTALEECGIKVPGKTPNAYELFNMLLSFITLGDDSLCFVIPLRKAKDDDSNFHFYGYDDKKRHIGFFGYGLFDK